MWRDLPLKKHIKQHMVGFCLYCRRVKEPKMFFRRQFRSRWASCSYPVNGECVPACLSTAKSSSGFACVTMSTSMDSRRMGFSRKSRLVPPLN
jgi:hypothetical protein